MPRRSAIAANEPQFNPGGFSVSSIAVDPHDATGQTVYVTMQGFSGNGISGGEVYGSVDGGAHWLNLTNSLPLAPANSIVVDPNASSTVYVALDTGSITRRTSPPALTRRRTAGPSTAALCPMRP